MKFEEGVHGAHNWSMASPLAIMPLFVLIALAAQVLFFGSADAQMPGHWAKATICTHCSPPVSLDFENSTSGVIVLASKRMGGSGPPQRTSIFVTHNGGTSWSLNVDTIYVRILRGDKAVVRNGHLLINSREGGILHSRDYGDSLETMYKERPLGEYDFIAANPSTMLIASRPGNDSYQTAEVRISRDSGRSFELLSTLEDTSYNILNVRFKDTNEFWARLVYRFDLGSRKSGRLIFTTNQGMTWSDVYPFDISELRNGEASFGNGWVYYPYEGLSFGAESGTVYLLQNFIERQGKVVSQIDLLLTTDHGKTWTSDSTHTIGERYLMDVDLIRNPSGTNLWLVTGEKKTLAYSPDNAKTWHHDSTTFRGDSILHMLWKDSVNGYVLSYKDSTVNFWKFVPGPSRVEHLDGYPTTFVRLAASVSSAGSLRVLALRPLSGEFSVYDILGRMVWRSPIAAATSEWIELDVPSSAGVYFLTYSQGTQRQTLRYVRE